MDLDLPEKPPERICVYTCFYGPPGRYDFFAILRNTKTGAAARAQSSAIIYSQAETKDTLSGPFLFIPGSQTSCLALGTETAPGKAEGPDFKLETLAPRAEGPVSPLIFSLSKDTRTLYAVFEKQDGVEETADLEFSARLFSADIDMDSSLLIAERKNIVTGRSGTLVCELEIPPFPPGQYTLEISVSGLSLSQKPVFTQSVSIR